jgi:hypothetical protein
MCLQRQLGWVGYDQGAIAGNDSDWSGALVVREYIDPFRGVFGEEWMPEGKRVRNAGGHKAGSVEEWLVRGFTVPLIAGLMSGGLDETKRCTVVLEGQGGMVFPHV